MRDASPPLAGHMTRPIRIAIAVVPVVAASGLGGLVTRANIPTWYAGIAKPFFTPPNWVFAPVWTLLFAGMALAAYRVLSRPPSAARTAALRIHSLQLALNVAWSAAFFGLNSPGAGLLVIAPLLAAIALTIRAFAPLDRPAAWLLAPYLAWVAYATALNLGIWWLNG